jgi:sugar phosphate isomerase/epimerase
MSVGAAMDLRFEETIPGFMEHVTDLGLDHVELKREYLHAPPASPAPARIGDLADAYDVSLTYHAPFRDWNLGSFNDASREAAVEQVKDTLDDAAAAGAGGVVVHGGSVPRRYPERVQTKAHENATRSLQECAAYAADVGVPLCLENQPRSDSKIRHTTTPDDLAAMLDSVDMDGLKVTLDIGHAKVNGHHWRDFLDEFGERVHVVHLHDNDGETDQHQPLSGYESVVAEIKAPYNVFEIKAIGDIHGYLSRATGK